MSELFSKSVLIALCIQYLSNCLFISIVASLGWYFLISMFSNIIDGLTGIPPFWVLTILLIIMFNFVISLRLSIWRLQNNPFAYSLFQFFQAFLVATTSVVFVVNFGWGRQGRIGAQLVVSGIFFLAFFLINQAGFFKIKLEIPYLKHALRFGVPLTPHVIGGQIMTISDRLFLTNMVGIAETGLYAVGFAFGNIIKLIEYFFYLAYQPWLFARLKMNNIKENIKIIKICYLFSIGILILALLLSGIAHLALNWFVGDKFAVADVFVIWIAVGFAVNGMYAMVTQFIIYTEKTLSIWQLFKVNSYIFS